MGIKLSETEVVPELRYEYIHITKLEIVQPFFEDDGQTPVYKVAVLFKRYGIDSNGQRYYKSGQVEKVYINDYIELAMTDAAQGDMALFGALQSIEKAVSIILKDQLGVETIVV